MVIPVETALLGAATEAAQDWVRAIARIAICLGLAFGILAGLAVLAWTFLRQSRADIRGPILVVWLGAAISFVPLLAFNVVPILIAQTNVVAFSTTQYALVALPLAVGFASIRWRKVSVLALIDRVSVYIVLGLLLLGCYAGLAVITTQLAGVETTSVSGLLTLALASAAATTFAPLRASIQRFIDTVLYRDHCDLGHTLQRLSQSLTLLRDRDALAISLLSDLCQTLNLHGAALVMLPGGLDPDMLRLIEPDDLYVCHDFADPAMRAAIARQLAQLDIATLAPTSCQPLALDLFPECAALGLISHGSLEDVIALLALGHKRSGGSLRHEDRTLLVTVLHQCATAFENATLIGGLHTTLAQLRRSSQQLESARAEAHLLLRELVGAEERQRANLTRELHDDALQDLLYVSRHSQYCANMLASLDGAGGMQSAALARLQEELDQLARPTCPPDPQLRHLS